MQIIITVQSNSRTAILMSIYPENSFLTVSTKHLSLFPGQLRQNFLASLNVLPLQGETLLDMS